MTKDEALKLALEAKIHNAGMNPIMKGEYYLMHPEAMQKIIDEALREALAEQEPVGEAGTMPGTSGFTMACFKASEVSLGTKLYTSPQPAQQQQPAGLLQEIARLHDRIKELEKDVEFLSLPAQQEPVAQWQLRHHLHSDGVWENCTDYAASLLQKEATFEIRRLYTSPQPAQQEPVAWVEGVEIYWHNAPDLNDWIRQNGQPLYTSPPARKPLTDDQILKIGRELGLKCRLGGNPSIDFDYARAIEAAHNIKEKNT